MWLLYILLVPVVQCMEPALYYADTGVVTVYVGSNPKPFNVELTTYNTDVLTLFSEECLAYRCLQFREIRYGYDDLKDQYNGRYFFGTGLSYWQLDEVPVQVGNLSLKSRIGTVHITGLGLDTKKLEDNTFNIYDGYLPLRFRETHFFDYLFNHSSQPKITLVPSSPSSFVSGFYVGEVPEGLCEPFQNIIKAGLFESMSNSDLGLLHKTTVRYAKKDEAFMNETWTVYLRFGPYFSFAEAVGQRLFGDLAYKEITERDFESLPEIIIVPLPGLKDLQISTKALYDKRGDFYVPIYHSDWIGDFGLNQNIMKDVCIRVEKANGDWMWGLSKRIEQ